jgi:hypothetical protein
VVAKVTSPEALALAARINRTGPIRGNQQFVISADGSQLIAAGHDAGHLNHYGLPTFALSSTNAFPAGTRAWVDFNSTATNTLLDAMTDTVVVSDGQGTVVGFPHEGHGSAWSQQVTAVCGVANSKVLVLANNQLAVLDATTGKQLSYTATSGGCPLVLPSGLGYDGTQLTQAL